MRIEIAPGVRLFVDVEGPAFVPDGTGLREKPTLLLLHGGPGFDHSSFKPLFSRLADVAQVVYYDHRGHGRSDPRPSEEWTLDTFADDVVRLCSALGIERPVVLGHSFGGFVAQRYLARHPAHPAAVVLSSTSPHLGLARKLAVFERLGGAAAREAAERFWTQPGAGTWAEYERVCLPLYNTRPAADPQTSKRIRFRPEILFAWAGGEQRSMNLLPGLAGVQCPVLVLVLVLVLAGDQDPVCPLEDAQDIAAALPLRWSRFACVEGAGHGTWRDRPDEVLARLRAFIGDGV
ncbi:alpha/beta hydrolase [Aquincola sp. MAHUQ-54]|uniref:Alpha/beta hydrolase n=1 Tax=Aquincola agrisoli TaxID=3119538 RepID=A0AAW9QA69_9BURK